MELKHNITLNLFNFNFKATRELCDGYQTVVV